MKRLSKKNYSKMEIKTSKELRDILNYERLRWRMLPITTRLGWFKTEIRFFLTLGSPYWYFYCLRNYEYYMQFKGVMGGGENSASSLLWI